MPEPMESKTTVEQLYEFTMDEFLAQLGFPPLDPGSTVHIYPRSDRVTIKVLSKK
jgi:hypothetical protein